MLQEMMQVQTRTLNMWQSYGQITTDGIPTHTVYYRSDALPASDVKRGQNAKSKVEAGHM